MALVAGAFAAAEAGRGLGEVGVDTLVLSRSGADILPKLYIGLGLVGLVVTLSYGVALSRSASERFFPLMLVVLAAVLASATLPGWPDVSPIPYAFALVESAATLRRFTIQAPEVARAVVVIRGEPILDDLSIRLEGSFQGWASGIDDPHAAIHFGAGAGGELTDSDIESGWVHFSEGASPVLANNDIACHMLITGPGTNPAIESNTIGGDACQWSVKVAYGAAPRIEGNDISIANVKPSSSPNGHMTSSARPRRNPPSRPRRNPPGQPRRRTVPGSSPTASIRAGRVSASTTERPRPCLATASSPTASASPSAVAGQSSATTKCATTWSA